MLVPWFNYNACSITRDSQGKRVQFARQHAKVRDFTSRHACLEVKFGFRQVQVCFIGGSLPVILSSMILSPKYGIKFQQIFDMLNIERSRALQSTITFFDTPCILLRRFMIRS